MKIGKGIFQLIPILVASIAGLAVTAFAVSSLINQIPKILFYGIAIISAYFAYQRFSQTKTIDIVTLSLLVFSVLILLFVVAGMKLFGLESIVPM